MSKRSSLLVKFIGFPATLIHGDTLMLDRWIWLRRRLPRVASGSAELLDVGCGSGAFTIGAARLGYKCLGLSWDERNQQTAAERAVMCAAPLAAFDVQDVRELHERPDLFDRFDVVVCFENIEHILNDQTLMIDMAQCLKPSGRLFLTSPNFDYVPMSSDDEGPFSRIEDGRHVRRGYTREDLERLCARAGLAAKEIGFCSGLSSQKITALQRFITTKSHYLVAWLITLPLRILPPVVDDFFAGLWPGYSIALTAEKRTDGVPASKMELANAAHEKLST
jgi:2-polyprenyl-3-methyl-5-hydroxy-6-metoxy-1,4-benzoquinol methylase